MFLHIFMVTLPPKKGLREEHTTKATLLEFFEKFSQVIASVYFTFTSHISILNSLFIGVVRPRFLPVCRKEVDPVCWSPVGQDILSHWHLLEIIMLLCRWENQVENWDKHVCISPAGMFHHMDRTQSWRSSQSRTWSISRIGRLYLGPVEVVLYSTVVFNLYLHFMVSVINTT